MYALIIFTSCVCASMAIMSNLIPNFVDHSKVRHVGNTWKLITFTLLLCTILLISYAAIDRFFIQELFNSKSDRYYVPAEPSN